MCRLQLRVFAQAEQKPDQQPEKQKRAGVQPAGNVTLSPALASEIRLQLQMVALQADDLLQKRQQIVGGGYGSAIKLGGLGRILAGDGPEYGKVLHFDVPCQEPPDPAQVPEHTADKGGRIMSEQVEGGLDTLRNMERQSAGFWMLSGKFSSGG